jgi:hypothetical protein
MKKILFLFIILLAFTAFYFVFKNEKPKESFETQEEILEEVKVNFDTSLLYGNWKSIDDQTFVRVINEDNTFQDTYGDEGIVSSGTWFVFDFNSKPQDFPYNAENGKNYLVMNDTNNSLYFIISQITEDSLTIIYLDNGSALQFNKIE